jgi:hypothetical protein
LILKYLLCIVVSISPVRSKSVSATCSQTKLPAWIRRNDQTGLHCLVDGKFSARKTRLNSPWIVWLWMFELVRLFGSPLTTNCCKFGKRCDQIGTASVAFLRSQSEYHIVNERIEGRYSGFRSRENLPIHCRLRRRISAYL